MKKTKVIIPALGILLLSTAASVTGTVAWYAANSDVYAENMNIKATTDSNFLAIAKQASLIGAGNKVTLVAPTGDVLPTDWYKDGTKDFAWVSAIGTAGNNGAAKEGVYTPLEGITDPANGFGVHSSKNYFVTDTVYVGLLGEASDIENYNLYCDVTFTASSASELNECLTLALDVGGDRGNADFDVRYVNDNATVNANPVTSETVIIPGAQLPINTGTKIKIYAFFDGNHASCTSEKAINLAGIDIDLHFELKKNS